VVPETLSEIDRIEKSTRQRTWYLHTAEVVIDDRQGIILNPDVHRYIVYECSPSRSLYVTARPSSKEQSGSDTSESSAVH
jgi:hypothetical protein